MAEVMDLHVGLRQKPFLILGYYNNYIHRPMAQDGGGVGVGGRREPVWPSGKAFGW